MLMFFFLKTPNNRNLLCNSVNILHSLPYGSHKYNVRLVWVRLHRELFMFIVCHSTTFEQFILFRFIPIHIFLYKTPPNPPTYTHTHTRTYNGIHVIFNIIHAHIPIERIGNRFSSLFLYINFGCCSWDLPPLCYFVYYSRGNIIFLWIFDLVSSFCYCCCVFMILKSAKIYFLIFLFYLFYMPLFLPILPHLPTYQL